MTTQSKENEADIRNDLAEMLSDEEFTFYLISLYRESPCLWKMKSEEYMEKQKKNIALQNMLRHINKYRTMDEKDLKRKINTLRTNFRREHNKVLSSIKSGIGSEQVYKPTLFYYEEFKFLIDQTEKEQTEATVMESGARSNAARKMKPECSPQIPQKKKKVIVKQEHKLLTDECPNERNVNSNLSDNEAFGQYTSQKLKQVLNQEQRMYAEAIITKTLNKAIMNRLTEYTDIIDNFPSR